MCIAVRVRKKKNDVWLSAEYFFKENVRCGAENFLKNVVH